MGQWQRKPAADPKSTTSPTQTAMILSPAAVLLQKSGETRITFAKMPEGKKNSSHLARQAP
jgi:hypothetical protein